MEDQMPNAWFFAQWLSLLGTIATCFVFLIYQNKEQAARTDVLYQQFQAAIIEQHARIDQQNARSDMLYQQFQSAITEQSVRIDQQNARSDQLYQMFYEVVKASKKNE
jgi:hypothetical protein